MIGRFTDYSEINDEKAEPADDDVLQGNYSTNVTSTQLNVTSTSRLYNSFRESSNFARHRRNNNKTKLLPDLTQINLIINNLISLVKNKFPPPPVSDELL